MDDIGGEIGWRIQEVEEVDVKIGITLIRSQLYTWFITVHLFPEVW